MYEKSPESNFFKISPKSRNQSQFGKNQSQIDKISDKYEVRKTLCGIRYEERAREESHVVSHTEREIERTIVCCFDTLYEEREIRIELRSKLESRIYDREEMLAKVQAFSMASYKHISSITRGKGADLNQCQIRSRFEFKGRSSVLASSFFSVAVEWKMLINASPVAISPSRRVASGSGANANPNRRSREWKMLINVVRRLCARLGLVGGGGFVRCIEEKKQRRRRTSGEGQKN